MAHLCAKVALQTVCDKAALAPSPTNSREISPQSLACSGHTPFHSRATCYWIFILHQRALHMGESEKYRAWSTACQNGKGRCPEFVGNSRWPTGHYLEPSWASSGQKLDRKQALIRHALMLLMPPDRHVGRHESGQCHSRRLTPFEDRTLRRRCEKGQADQPPKIRILDAAAFSKSGRPAARSMLRFSSSA